MRENKNIIIREADPGDIEDICRLLALLFKQEAEFEPDYAKQKRGVSEIVSDLHKGMFLVIEEAERIIAQAFCFWSPQRLAEKSPFLKIWPSNPKPGAVVSALS